MCFEREQLCSMKYRTFHAGLLAVYEEEIKRLSKFGGLVHISCRKIEGAESLEEIRYNLQCCIVLINL